MAMVMQLINRARGWVRVAMMKNDRKGLGIRDKKQKKTTHFRSKNGKSLASTNLFVHAIQKQQYQWLQTVHNIAELMLGPSNS